MYINSALKTIRYSLTIYRLLVLTKYFLFRFINFYVIGYNILLYKRLDNNNNNIILYNRYITTCMYNRKYDYLYYMSK